MDGSYSVEEPTSNHDLWIMHFSGTTDEYIELRELNATNASILSEQFTTDRCHGQY